MLLYAIDFTTDLFSKCLETCVLATMRHNDVHVQMAFQFCPVIPVPMSATATYCMTCNTQVVLETAYVTADTTD
jgi:Na+-translocating ferredoxin:NAD+ oxidoreductase RnfE subunit